MNVSPSGPGQRTGQDRAAVTRRRFLVASAGGLLAAAVGLSTLSVLRRPALSRRLELYRERLAWASDGHLSLGDRVRKHFEYLQLDPGGVEAFAAAYTRHQGEPSRFRPPGDDIFARFLLSTDFFANGGDEQRIIRYVTFYDPYVSPCWNPCPPAV